MRLDKPLRGYSTSDIAEPGFETRLLNSLMRFAHRYDRAMGDDADGVLNDRAGSLRLILEVAERFDEYVTILRSVRDPNEAGAAVARAFGCTEADAVAIVLPCTVQRLVLPAHIQRFKDELAELGP